MLPLSGDGHVAEGLLVPQMLEGGDHVGLEVVPAETKLLIIGRHPGSLERREILKLRFSVLVFFPTYKIKYIFLNGNMSIKR